MHPFPRLPRFLSIVAAALIGLPALVRGELDERPLAVAVVPAFPDVSWPGEFTGEDEGKLVDPRPLVITGAGDGSGRIFVADQRGVIHLVPRDRRGDLRTFLDLRDRVHYRVPEENEEGFLGLAFHPRYEENGEFFVYYTHKHASDAERRSVISRFRVSQSDGDVADPLSEEVILEIHQPYWNHNAGTLAFGPDGYLYVAVGDGGLRDDPHMNGQNLQSLLAKILRIDVDRRDGDRAYAIPADNPFADPAVNPELRYARGEIWAYGLRNVWRMAFDRETGDLWAGDVGQDAWEEIDVIRRGGNYGWNLREGRHKFGPFGGEARADLVEPVWDYHHAVGKSVTGGCVYRGRAVPELRGGYLYADFVTGRIAALWVDQAMQTAIAHRQIVPGGAPVTSFGEDDEGEVYYCTQEGGLWKFAPRDGHAAAE
jgi:glucose/arabinose dehydrogenase